MRWRRSLAVAPLFLAILLPTTSARAGEGEWVEGPVEVLRAFQPGIIEIGRDGRSVPLHVRGVDSLRRADTSLLRIALDRVREWVGGGQATLVDPRPGPGGTLVGSLRLGDGSDLGERLLREGLALYQPRDVSEPTRLVLLQAQRQAVVQERGIWGLPKMETADVPRFDGQVAKICGDVLAAQQQSDRSWMVYLGRYPQREVAVRIPAEHAAAFGAPDLPFIHQEVCVTARIGHGDVLPEMTVFEPKQIEQLGMGQSF